MRLFIAEKPSLAKAIAAALPEPHKRIEDGNAIQCGDNDVVAWCVGHILEAAPPDAYGDRYKKWTIEDLPIIPEDWKQQVTKPKLLKAIKNQLKTATLVVNAGDPDPEGQFLVDEVLFHINNTKPVKRALINNLNQEAVKSALNNLRDNSDFLPLYESCLARSRADWLYGLNMTRLYTLLGRAGGHDEVLSVGRVQTPLLGLIVNRDNEIATFTSKPFYTIAASLKVARGSFTANWQAGESSKIHLDEEGRLVNQEYAKQLAQQLQNAVGIIQTVDRQAKKTKQPLPFSLNGKNGIQLAAAKRHDYSAQEVLDACQSLYERHKLTTYPRSDCPYIPENHHKDAPQIIEVIQSNLQDLTFLRSCTNTAIRSAAWNDKKITAHHAIIPTDLKVDTAKLTAIERNIYTLICEGYLLQFYPEHEYDETKVTAVIAGEKFTKTAKIVTLPGWKGQLLTHTNDDNPDEGDAAISLPPVQENEACTCELATVNNKRTTPPKPFTNASVATAMSGIAKFVTNPKIKALLRDSDGIGTPATQAGIIETLYKRQYIQKKGKAISATGLGQFMVKVLPETSTTPDMTAFWESAMHRIRDRDMDVNTFLTGIEKQIKKLMADGVALKRLTIPNVIIHNCPAEHCDGQLKRRKGSHGFFWGCTSFQMGCKETRPDKSGKPDFNPKPQK